MDVLLTPALRYWELEAHKIAGLLQEIRSSGGGVVGAWVPWAHLESDRKQALRKFLKQATQFGLKVRLVVTPEANVGYMNGGIPADLIRRNENQARDRTGQTIYACAPPNIFPLVNLNAPQVFQRYGHFLLKLSQEVAQVVEENIDARVELVVGDSFFKHYNTLGLPAKDHGDFSSLFFQKELDFMQGWTPAQAERMFRARAIDFLASRFERSVEVSYHAKNFWMRGASLDRLVDELSGAVISPEQVFAKLRLARPRCDAVWLDDLSLFQGKSKTFLVSSALALYGDIWLTAEDYLELSPKFRQKMAQFGESLSGEEGGYDRPVLCIVQNRFAPARLSEALRTKLGQALEFRSSLFELKPAEFERIRMMVVEEALVIEYDQFQALVKRAKEERVTIAMFRSSLCKRAQAEASCLNKFKLRHGWSYEVSMFESGGHLIIIDSHDTGATSMVGLAERLLAVGGVESWCVYENTDVTHISFSPSEDPAERILFFLNPLDQAQELSVRFLTGARLEGMLFQAKNSDNPRPKVVVAGNPPGHDEEELVTNLPAQAVVPLRVSLTSPEPAARVAPMPQAGSPNLRVVASGESHGHAEPMA